MINPSMSKLEICDALFKDLPEIKQRIDYLKPRMVKRFKKDNVFPNWKWEEYTHLDSQNKHLISFSVSSPTQTENPDINYVTFINDGDEKIVIQWGCWQYRERGSITATSTRYIGFFSQHFFSRYRERVWKNASMPNNELISRYFSRNIETTPLLLNNKIKRNYKEYGELARYAFKVSEGTCFIRFWNEGDIASIGNNDCDFISVVLYYTFVSDEMMDKTQLKAVYKEGLKYFREHHKSLFNDLLSDAINRSINSSNNIVKGMPPMITLNDCENIGHNAMNKLFKTVEMELNLAHPSSTQPSYFSRLSKDLSDVEGTLQEAFPDAYKEISAILHQEYCKLDELEQHGLFIYLLTNDKDENEIVQYLLWHIEEHMEDLGFNSYLCSNNKRQ